MCCVSILDRFVVVAISVMFSLVLVSCSNDDSSDEPAKTVVDTSITAGPTDPTNSTSANFEFISSVAGSTFECALDSNAYVACISSISYEDLTDGNHTFCVRVISAENKVDPSPACYSWIVDQVPPDTSITSGPGLLTNVTGASFVFASTESGSVFECSLDSGAYSVCSSPVSYESLASGSHDFSVRASDVAGNTDATPVTYNWKIDVTVPSIVGNAFPIATNSVGNGSLSAAFDGTNWLVGILSQNLSGAGATQVVAQMIDATGLLVGSQIEIATTTSASGFSPELAPQIAFDGTNYLLVWGDNTNSTNIDIYGQLINTSGVKVGSAFPISVVSGNQMLGINSIVFDGTNYLIVWDDQRVSASMTYVYGQLVSVSGALVGLEIKISNNPGKISSVGFDGTNHLVVWDNGTNILGQFINTAGAFIGTELNINTKQQIGQDYNPVGIAFDGDNFLIVWHDRVGDGGVAWDLFGQLIDMTGVPVGGVIPVSTESGTQIFAFAAFDGDNFLIAWSDASNDGNNDLVCDTTEGSCVDINGLHISTAGARVGPKFAINTGAGNQLGVLAGNGGGQYLVLVNQGFSLGNQGFTNDTVYGQIITPNPTTGTLSGSVAGTQIIAVNDAGEIVASDDTAGKIPNVDGSYPFTLTGIPVGVNIRVYLATSSGVYPLYFDSASTNVFTLSSVVDIDLGYVDITLLPGKATPEKNPTAVVGVNAGLVNATTLVIVTDEDTGAPIAGATVIVDHASEPRQMATTSATGSASFIPPSSGNVTVTIGKDGYDMGTLVDFDLIFLNTTLTPKGLSASAFVQGTTTNYSGLGGVVINGGSDELNDRCATCENISGGVNGFYRLTTNNPNNTYNLSAFDFAGDIASPSNFTAVTGVGPLTDGQTLVVDLAFPVIPPANASTTGAISVPANLGSVSSVIAVGGRDLISGTGELAVGISVMTAAPYDYALTTFDFTGAGSVTSMIARAEGISGGVSHSVKRGVNFGDSGVNFSLIDVPSDLAPVGTCGSVTPTISWTGVTGVSFYGLELNDSDTVWFVIADGGTTTFTLPDLTGTPLAGLGLTAADPVSWNVQTIVVPEYNLNTATDNKFLDTLTDFSQSETVTCTP